MRFENLKKTFRPNLFYYLRSIHWGVFGRSGMKWDEFPRSLAFAPLLLGMVAASLPYLIEHPHLREGSLLGPFLLTLLAALQFPFYPQAGDSRRGDMIAGIYVGMIAAFLPQLIFFVWFIPMILLWLHQTGVIWERNYPPFRVGLWIGLGVVSGLFVGGILAHFFL